MYDDDFGGYGGLGIGNPGSYGGVNDPGMTSDGGYSSGGMSDNNTRREMAERDFNLSKALGIGFQAPQAMANQSYTPQSMGMSLAQAMGTVMSPVQARASILSTFQDKKDRKQATDAYEQGIKQMSKDEGKWSSSVWNEQKANMTPNQRRSYYDEMSTIQAAQTPEFWGNVASNIGKYTMGAAFGGIPGLAGLMALGGTGKAFNTLSDNIISGVGSPSLAEVSNMEYNSDNNTVQNADSVNNNNGYLMSFLASRYPILAKYYNR